MNVFKKIPIPNRTEKDKIRPSVSPISNFLAEHKQKQIAFVFGIACLVFSIVAQVMTVKNMHRPEKVFVIDGTNTLHIGPLEILGQKSPLFTTIALVATQVILQRSPVGLDLAELMPHLFKEEAMKKLTQDVAKNLGELKAKDLHQKPEISQIKSLAEKDGNRILQVTGTLIGSGIFEGIPLLEAHKFKITFAIRQNQNLSENKLYPFIIADFKINELEPL